MTLIDKVIRLTNIRRTLSLKSNPSTNYLLCGRVNKFRSYKKFHFVDLVDGSCNDHIQVILPRDLVAKPELGAYLQAEGKLVESQGSAQEVEFRAEQIRFYGSCDPLIYPLATSDINQVKPGLLNNDWYRRFPHLRPRAPHFASMLRIKSELDLAIHMIMRQMEFIRVHTPSLTANDSEASSDLFRVSRTKLTKNLGSSESSSESDVSDDEFENDNRELPVESNLSSVNSDGRISRDDYFKSDVYLVTSAQLHLENLAAALSRVYTISSTFRAENSISTRHLCEFQMFELEESSVSELSRLIDRAESIIKFTGQFLGQVSDFSSDTQTLVEQNSNQNVYSKMTDTNFVRMTYTEAMNILRNKVKFFSKNTNYGADIGRVHEKELLKYTDNVPIFITNYPKSLKPFYMKCDASGNEVECFDLIAPIGGEICGGSLREDSLDRLVDNLKSHCHKAIPSGSSDKCDEIMTRFNWYLDTRRFGSFPHGGFGIGIERLVQSFLGIKNIKDTTAFPRWTGHCPM